MKPETLTALKEEINEIEKKISDLLNDKTDIQNLILKYENPIVQLIGFDAPVKKEKAHPVKEKKVNPKAEGRKLGMSKLILKIMAAHPDKEYLTKDLEPAIQKAIDNGQLDPPNDKVLKDGICKRLYALEKGGKVRKNSTEKGMVFKFNGPKEPVKAATRSAEMESMSVLDDAIVEYLSNHDPVSEYDLTNKIRLSAEFGDISRELNGTLASAVEKSVENLCKAGMIYQKQPGIYSVS